MMLQETASRELQSLLVDEKERDYFIATSLFYR
jgi:hypothetical protein